MSLFGKLKQILKKQSKDKIEDIEEFLIENNFGVEFTENFLDDVREKRIKDIENYLKEKIRAILSEKDSSLNLRNKPSVFLFVGTNGSGKTTSIAKIANILKEQGKSVMFVAGDTFRAAASEQLAKWAEKLNVPIVKQGEGSDPAAVVYDGLESAFSKKIDVVLVDSAGRVETKKNLMNELSKIERVIEKRTRRKPDEVLLVLDAYTGQNGLAQIETFSKAVRITGIVLTKVDGSSAGGIVVPIVEKYGIPIKFLGTGESLEDMEFFDTERYLNILM